MSIEVVMGEAEEISDTPALDVQAMDPDEFFAKNAFRIVYLSGRLDFRHSRT